MNLDIEQFIELSKNYNVIPLYQEIMGDICTPVSAYLKLKKKPSFLLESVVGGEKWGRYSFIGFDPIITVRFRDGITQIITKGKRPVSSKDDPLDVIKRILSSYKTAPIEGLPRFFGGFVGYIGYDVVKLFEKVPDISKPAIDIDDVFMILPQNLIIFDNLKQTIKILYNAHLNDTEVRQQYKKAEEGVKDTIENIKKGASVYHRIDGINQSDDIGEIVSNFKHNEFINAVIKAKEYILNGDIIQVVLSQRFEKRLDTKPFDIYRALRVINPSPYMYFLDTKDTCLIGSSPEILVRYEDKKITVRPIAGTRRRGKNEEEDRHLENDLLSDPKERAEHIMLVDLGRNDVGKVSKIGSVKVTDLMSIERYSHVMHIVSNVEGLILDGLDAFDVFRATFPAGTVTGAPKVRAMQIIEELEPTKRGAYAGAVGYFGYLGNMDTCITIRTLVVKDDKVYIQAGAGIVADSDPESEYTETINKAKAMLKSLSFWGE
ncbi:MAG: anthranilate synthase component I [Thermodesulfovibrionales bacterium]|nr:anthranilate synthase component I [Thermodesulfovibrionales bacterium]